MTPREAISYLRRKRTLAGTSQNIYGELLAVFKSLLRDRTNLQLRVNQLESMQAAWKKRTTQQPEDKLTWDLPREIRD
jgi:hypothetical protein